MSTGMDLTTIYPLVTLMAGEQTRGKPWLFEDARQEGLIKAWQASESKPEAGRQYAAAAARHGVWGVVTGRHSYTGQPSRAGTRGRWDAMPGAVSSDALTEDGISIEHADETAGLPFEVADMTDVRARVRAAVSALPDARDREIVYLAFWSGLNFAEIGARYGTTKAAIRGRWMRAIKPALLLSLEGAR